MNQPMSRDSEIVAAWSEAQTLEELERVDRPDYLDSSLSASYRINLVRVMMLRVSQVRTPEDVLATHSYFRHHGAYSAEVQQALGEKALEVIGKWKESQHRGSSSRV